LHPPFLCFSHLRWNLVFQRPHHLLTRAARYYDVTYFEEPIFSETLVPELLVEPVARNINVATPVLPTGMPTPASIEAQRQLLDAFIADLPRQNLLAWYYTPMALPFTNHLSCAVSIYDNMDELSAFRGASRALVSLERALFKWVDVVFSGGQSLYEAKRLLHGNIHPFPSSIDVDHFAAARNKAAPEPADQACIPRPRAGFFGVIDERMDLSLVERLADLNPELSLVMIGPIAKIDASSLPQRPNLHWLGARKYDALPSYLAGWEVGLMPFALNESTRYISPTKTPEFLAAGVPVVSTPIADVVRPYGEAGLVEIAGTAEEFSASVRVLLDRPKPEWLEAVDRQLSSSSWDQTWAAMHRIILDAQAAYPAQRYRQSPSTSIAGSSSHV
jgi:glycosyltransferase involved in cell wall biosynthesis